jgi:tetratricopeptide (TPR) repeat protein
LVPAHAWAQTGGGHILFGDLKVDESKAPNLQPQTFQVMLCNLSGEILFRQTVSAGGRYRFLDVSNGDYYLVVEMGNEEVARIQLLIMEKFKTDIRHDIELAWQPGQLMQSKKISGVISARDFYKRDKDNAGRLEDALAASRQKDYKRALSLLDAVVSADPRDLEAWTELGTAHFMLGNYREAEKCYRRSLAERPSYPLALLNLGRLHMAQKNFQAAVETLEQLIILEPGFPDVHSLLAESYLQIKKGSKAEVHFKEALRLDPGGQADAHLRLAALYNAAGYKNLAAAEYEQFLAKRPNYPEKKKLQDYIRQNKP